ncbi:MAG TPA: PrsW family glutamic-type intramembrane protease [Candidatus Krumholzibacteria bacterium]|nr:PrsW family glutamic-type intramembrane protease [Candidatus Krumholzibacteria bacterium]
MQFLGLPFSVIPVFCFLALLILMDSFKLVPLRFVLRTIVVGCLAAVVALRCNTWLLDGFTIDPRVFQRYVAPVLEESIKAAYLVWLIRRQRVGFVIDAAIHGFALGAGFALVENVFYYFQMRQEASLFLWVVRGFGTAVIHGSTMAMFATVSKTLSDRRGSMSWRCFLPGLALAVVVHSFFNHFLLHPMLMTAMLLVVLPLLVVVVFEQSERATRHWLGSGFDSDAEILELITSEDVRQTHVGVYLQSLRSHFPAAVVADILCYLQIYLELSMRAKTHLMAREAGVVLPVDDSVAANLQELRYLDKAIGKTGKLAILPFLRTSSRDLWQLNMLRS